MKRVSIVLVFVFILFSIVAMTACSDEVYVYDAGEYGEVQRTLEGSVYGVSAKEGYRFLGWSEPIKEGGKTIFKAQYEHIEYYLSEVKDVYVFEQGYQNGPSIIGKITDMQTGQQREIYVNLHNEAEVDYSGDGVNGQGNNLTCFRALSYPYEFDIIAKVTVDNPTYNIVANFKLHFVRNRISAESISVTAEWVNNVVDAVTGNHMFFISTTTLPDDTSYSEVGCNILSVFRDGQDITDKEQISKITYFNYRYLYVTDQAQAGDIISIEVFNKRDPQVKSGIIRCQVPSV